MSFVEQEDVMNLTENLVAYVFKKIKNIDVSLPLMRMKYDDAINFYGSDKPDLRFDMKINDITNIFVNTNFSIFQNVLKDKGIINCLVVKNKADSTSRKDIDKLSEMIKTYKVNGLSWLKYNNNEFTGSIVKVLSEEELNKIVEETNNLILRQSTPDSPELLETIPLLSLDDIGKEVEDLTINKVKHNNIEILHCNTFTSNIAYLNFMFYGKCIAEEDIPYFAFSNDCLVKRG